MLYRNLIEFIFAHSKNKRIMCLDYGEKKIGIALSDKTNLIAFPHSVYYRQNRRRDVGTILNIFKENDGGSMVIGFPLKLNGTENELCQKVIIFAQQIIKKNRVNIYLHDERYTTAMATSITKIAQLKRKEAQKIDDKIASTIILQQVLNMAVNFMNKME